MQIPSLFSRKASWDWVLILTYDVYPITFFEMEILSNLSVNKNLTIVMDESNYHQLVSDKYFKPNYLGVYYNLESIRIRNGGNFHPKLYLFLSEDTLCVHIGSFNLTDTGFKRNLETLLSFEFKLDELKQDDIGFIRQISSFLKNAFLTPNTLVEKVSNPLKNLIVMMLSSPFFKTVEPGELERILSPDIAFLSTVDRSLFSEIRNIIGNKAQKTQILSPFYDHNLESFKTLMKYTDKASIYIPSSRSTFPKELFSNKCSAIKNITFHSICTAEHVERFVHAKYMRFEVEGKVFDFVTSANFSGAGFLNDRYPRNFEIGIIFKSTKNKFLESSGTVIEKISNFSSIKTDPSINDNSPKETMLRPIEVAQYVKGKIFIQFSKSFLDTHAISDIKIQLIIDNDISGAYVVQQDGDNFYIEPTLDIEGNRVIQIKLLTTNPEEVGIVIYVNRDHHDPNYLPSLGASAFNTCVQIGGVEGVARAFEYAQNSGRKDWLIYLLSHWNLEKILRGINRSNPDKNEEGATIDEDNLPSLPAVDALSRRKNINHNIGSIISEMDIYKNLTDFMDELDSTSSNIDNKIDNCVRFCFPIFEELSHYFTEILTREEIKKISKPFLEYPEYTWGHNYNKYERYLDLIVEKLIKLIDPLRDQYRNDKIYVELISKTHQWLRVHTKNILSEYCESHSKAGLFISFIVAEKKRVAES